MSDKFMERTLEIMTDKKVSVKELCGIINVTPASFSQWKTEKTRVTATNRRNIAAALKVSLEYLETGIHKTVFSAPPIIRSLLDLEAFALAVRNITVHPGLTEVARKSGLSDQQWLERFNKLDPSRFANTLDKTVLFCWQQTNDAMTSPNGSESYPKGAEIIFDPRTPPQEGGCILVVVDGCISFRRWAEIDGVQYLTLINPNYNDGTAIKYKGEIWDIWVGTPVAYVMTNNSLYTPEKTISLE